MHTDRLSIRGHHLLCMFGFRGLGYNPRFVANMRRVVEAFFSDSPHEVTVIAECDDICRACPHLVGGVCRKSPGSQHSVAAKDLGVLDHLGLALGTTHAAPALRTLITRTVRPVNLRAMCSGCEWLPTGYCEAGLKASLDET